MKFRYIFYAAWGQALMATVGSLYFSEIAGLPPCQLCWYQRILMYPLTIIIMVGILRRDKGLPVYVLPLSVSGMVVAFYQYLLQKGVFSESIVPCRIGVPCSTIYGQWFGFVTIPFLSLVAFLVITGLMIIAWKKRNE